MHYGYVPLYADYMSPTGPIRFCRKRPRSKFTNKPSRLQRSRASFWRCENENASLHRPRRREGYSDFGERSESSGLTWASRLVRARAALSNTTSARNQSL